MATYRAIIWSLNFINAIRTYGRQYTVDNIITGGRQVLSKMIN